MFWISLLLFNTTLLAVFIAYMKWCFTYWNQRNLPFIKPKFPFGNLENPLTTTKTAGLIIKNLYEELKEKKLKHGGIYFFATPSYLPIDLNYVKNILTKDFQYFVDRGVYYNEKSDPISANLFAIGGSKWRNLRTKLSPTFTSGKMKMMLQTLLDCEENLQERVKILCEKKQSIDVKDVIGCFTTDVIGSCAFGLDCNTFREENSPFRVYGKKVFSLSRATQLRLAFAVTFPNVAEFLNMTLYPKDVSNFFMKIVKETVDYREKNGLERKDFMQLLINLKNSQDNLTMEELTAQCVLFFLAGFETSATTMTFALYELAKNQEIQRKVREEIETVLGKNGGKLSYEAIQDLKYMQQVLDETLRKYPPVPFTTRECGQDYKISDENTIEKGTRIIIPTLGIHYDAEYYSDPEKFDPDRFNEDNSKSRHQYAHIPFGEGPRICLGLRFGLMQSKVGLTSLLKRYTFKLSKRTRQPLKFAVDSFVLAAEGGIWLDAEEI